jgi:hypothetical protein
MYEEMIEIRHLWYSVSIVVVAAAASLLTYYCNPKVHKLWDFVGTMMARQQ